MRLLKILTLILIAVMITVTGLSVTMASYTDAFSGSGTALVARWNMGARGEDDPAGDFYNKGFTFDLFGARSVRPMDDGEKSFTFRGGGSDVGIAYDVRMNAADLTELTTAGTRATIATEPGKQVYAPFIFRITAELTGGGGAPAVFSPYGQSSPYYGSGWFRPKDVEPDEDGYFSLFEGTPGFAPGSGDEVTVTVQWQWNTSFYINDTGIAAVTPPRHVAADPETSAGYPPYYRIAYDQYYGAGGLMDQYTAAVNTLEYFLEEQGGPDSDGTWPPEYMDYTRSLDDAARACQTSLLTAYDDYDTFAAGTLQAEESAKVLFRVTGVQIEPQGENDSD